jgi:hypothetical protein
MADVEKTSLGSETLNLMEQVVHWAICKRLGRQYSETKGPQALMESASRSFQRTFISIGPRYGNNFWMALSIAVDGTTSWLQKMARSTTVCPFKPDTPQRLDGSGKATSKSKGSERKQSPLANRVPTSVKAAKLAQ